MKKLVFLVFSLLVGSCAQYSQTTTTNSETQEDTISATNQNVNPEVMESCAYDTIHGEEIILGERDFNDFLTYYSSFKIKPSMYALNISYEEYKGTEGKIIDTVRSDMDHSGSLGSSFYTNNFYKIVLSNCEVVYVTTGLGGYEYYTKSSYKDAEKLRGETIWIDGRKNINEILQIYGFDTEFDHLEPVYVNGIYPQSYALKNMADLEVESLDVISSISLIVKNSKINKAYIPFNDRYYFKENPLEESWSPNIKSTIKNQEIMIGMSEKQARLSWGPPNDINRTVTSETVNEQWIYGDVPDAIYLYFENGKLNSYQE